MPIESGIYGSIRGIPGLLLLLDPKQFFTMLSSKPASVCRHLLFVSLAAAALHYVAGPGWNNWFGSLIFFLNAMGMTCIYSGFVFIFARSILGPPSSFGRVFTICVYASLGPILISWIPGGVWIAEPWKWWTSVIGLSAHVPAGFVKSAMVVACALVSVYVVFQTLLIVV